LESNAKKHTIIKKITAYTVHHVSVPLLQQQEEYFGYISDGLAFLNHEWRKLAGKLANHPFSMPPKMLQPLLHNR
jgi:hypothetical protein